MFNNQLTEQKRYNLILRENQYCFLTPHQLKTNIPVLPGVFDCVGVVIEKINGDCFYYHKLSSCNNKRELLKILNDFDIKQDTIKNIKFYMNGYVKGGRVSYTTLQNCLDIKESLTYLKIEVSNIIENISSNTIISPTESYDPNNTKCEQKNFDFLNRVQDYDTLMFIQLIHGLSKDYDNERLKPNQDIAKMDEILFSLYTKYNKNKENNQISIFNDFTQTLLKEINNEIKDRFVESVSDLSRILNEQASQPKPMELTKETFCSKEEKEAIEDGNLINKK